MRLYLDLYLYFYLDFKNALNRLSECSFDVVKDLQTLRGTQEIKSLLYFSSGYNVSILESFITL